MCPKLKGQDLNNYKYIYADGALTCCIVKQSTWLWRAKTTLKTTNSLKSWWFMQAEGSALGQLLESGEAAQAHGPFSLWVMELMVGPGEGWSRAGRSTSLNPPAREKWLIHDVFLGPLYYTLMDQHRNIRGFSLVTTLWWPNLTDFI